MNTTQNTRSLKSPSNSKLNPSHADPNQAKGQGEVNASLNETLHIMKNELIRMKETDTKLHTSSKTIETSQKTFQVFGLNLINASALLMSLKRRAENDSIYIWYAFLFFLGCCGFVLLKRLGIFRTVFTMLNIGGSLACWFYSFFYQSANDSVLEIIK